MVDTVVDAVPVSGTNRDPVRQFVVRGSRFEVASKYTLIKAVGKGAYGVVCSCRDTETGLKVAVKKVEDAIVDPVDAKRTLREIKLAQLCRPAGGWRMSNARCSTAKRSGAPVVVHKAPLHRLYGMRSTGTLLVPALVGAAWGPKQATELACRC